MRRHNSGSGFEEIAFSDVLKEISFVTSVWNIFLSKVCEGLCFGYVWYYIVIHHKQRTKGNLPVEIRSDSIVFSNLPVSKL